MNNLVTYGQTFSKGQLTIPKKIRDYHGLGENFAYKISSENQKIIIEPQSKAKKAGLFEALTKIKQPVFSDQDYQDYLEIRRQDEIRAKELGI